jgi:hypothetical protein
MAPPLSIRLVILGEVHLHQIKQAAREAACMVGSVPNCQPTRATRIWASASAAVVGCAGNWSTVAS